MKAHVNHPLPTILYHWVNLIAMVILVVTGFYINKPFFEGWMAEARYLHFVAMFAIIANMVLRIYYAFFGKEADAKKFKLGLKDWQPFVSTLKYYMHLSDTKEGVKGYNPLQRISYLSVPVLIILQAVTGFALYYPEALSGLVNFLGGLHLVRIQHYILMWVFIAFTIFHVYMVLAEAPEEAGVMLFNTKPAKDKVDGGTYEENPDLRYR